MYRVYPVSTLFQLCFAFSLRTCETTQAYGGHLPKLASFLVCRLAASVSVVSALVWPRFGITPAESKIMDPQQRVVLEVGVGRAGCLFGAVVWLQQTSYRRCLAGKLPISMVVAAWLFAPLNPDLLAWPLLHKQRSMAQ